MKIKTFSGTTTNEEELDSRVNEWMLEHKNDQIVQMAEHVTGGDGVGGSARIVITFIYRSLITPATDTTPAVYD